MDNNQIAGMIRRHEGTRYDVYRDSEGVLTCGVGHALHEGSFMPSSAVNALFSHDLSVAHSDYTALKFELSPVRRAVITDMLFNLGLVGLLKFKKMIAAIHDGRCEDAVWEMMDSKWYSQVGRRSEELAIMFYDNEYYETEWLQSEGVPAP